MINQEEVLVPQPRLGTAVYVTTLIIMMTVQWMTLDMYLPALPVLKEQFGASEALLNISLNSDLFACAIGTLIGGTISDKYGRNPIMIIGWGSFITGIAVITGACAVCAALLWIHGRKFVE